MIALTTGLIAGDLDKSRTVGFQINPIYWGSAGFSYFNHEKGYEIALPFFFLPDAFYADLKYRQYDDGRIGGFHYGGFMRLSYMNGKIENERKNARITKVGLGGELGYKVVNLWDIKGLYWGSSLSVGMHLSDNNDRFEEAFLGDSIAIVDIEFMKLGYAF